MQVIAALEKTPVTGMKIPEMEKAKGADGNVIAIFLPTLLSFY